MTTTNDGTKLDFALSESFDAEEPFFHGVTFLFRHGGFRGRRCLLLLPIRWVQKLIAGKKTITTVLQMSL